MKEIKFENIQKANETIITTDVKGKQYAEVNQRIKAFRMVYPTGTIKTEMISNENGVCIFRAEIYSGKIIIGEEGIETPFSGEILLATGTAYEKENSTFINKTSYIENCETSAIGRALGIAGFGIDTSVASAEEVQNAINNQTSDEKLELMNKIKVLVLETDTDYDDFLKYFKVESNSDMSVEQLKEGIKLLEQKRSKNNGNN